MGTTTILIDDDEPANLSLLTHLLRPFYQLLADKSGEYELRAATNVPQPELVLIDVMTAVAAQYIDRVNSQR